MDMNLERKARKNYRFSHWSSPMTLVYGMRLMAILAGFLGFLIWLIISNWALNTVEAMLCFIGAPIVITYHAIFFYAWKHDFTFDDY